MCIRDSNHTDRSPSNDLLRALHTLTGSSRTTGITSVSELCSLFEKYIKELQEYHQPVDANALGVLEELHTFVSRVVELIDQPGTEELPDGSGLMTSLQGLLDSLEAPESSASLQQPEVEPQVPDVSEVPEAPAEIPETPQTTAPAEYDEELLDIFIEEGEEILEQSDLTLLQWRDDPDNQELIEALQRQLHTLKGGARMAGVSEIGDLGHSIESMLTAVVDGHLVVSTPMFSLMQRAQDRLVGMLEQVKASQRPSRGNDLIQEVDTLLGRASLGRQAEDAVQPDEVQTADESPTVDEVLTLEDDPAVELVETAAESASEPPASAATQELQEEEDDGSRERRRASRVQHEQVRVRADLLDNLSLIHI